MTPVFSTVEEYIQTFDEDTRLKLNTLHHFILSNTPSETTTTITYKMPTYRYNGNLFHFAQFSKHLGLYPGIEAMEHFENKLSTYKTSKGTIQIPNDTALPFDLILEILSFNVNRLKDKKGPTWHDNRSLWTDAEEIMEQIIVPTPLIKTFKWNTNVYTYNDKNVVAWGGFKHFFSIWFYNGVFLEDKEKVLTCASEGKTKALRQWRFNHVNEMNAEKISAYIYESIQTVIDGKEVPVVRAEEKEITEPLKSFLETNVNLKQAFNQLSISKRNEYITFIDEAKQEKTKWSRLEKINPIILAGKGLNDKYKK